MRHRYRIALYSDHPLEAELADYIADLDQGRRQEVMRALLRAGFNELVRGRESTAMPGEALPPARATPAGGRVAPPRPHSRPNAQPRGRREATPDGAAPVDAAGGADTASPVQPVEQAVVGTVPADPQASPRESVQKDPGSEALPGKTVDEGDLLEEPPPPTTSLDDLQPQEDGEDFVDPLARVAAKMNRSRGSS